MGLRSRRKGAAFECELSRLLAALWPSARRGIGQARSAKEVCDVEGTPFWVEAKHRKKCAIQAAYNQAAEATDGRPILVVTKDNRCPPLVTLSLTSFLDLLGTLLKKE